MQYTVTVQCNFLWRKTFGKFLLVYFIYMSQDIVKIQLVKLGKPPVLCQGFPLPKILTICIWLYQACSLGLQVYRQLQQLTLTSSYRYEYPCYWLEDVDDWSIPQYTHSYGLKTELLNYTIIQQSHVHKYHHVISHVITNEQNAIFTSN